MNHTGELNAAINGKNGTSPYFLVILNGKRVLAVGDQQQGAEGLLWNYVYQGRFHHDDYWKSAALYRKLLPDVIVSGYSDPLWVAPDYWDQLEERGEALASLHRELLPLGEIDLGAEGFVARMKPYQLTVAAGEPARIEVELLNPFPAEEEVRVELVTPAHWEIDNREQSVRLAGFGQGCLAFVIAVPPDQPAQDRVRIAADVTVGGRRFGQQSEALVNIR
ncbi:MAG: hypothetical protein J7639_02865 [Paenibacillaceae bacterium]|nr:hypothetical protein [Paenibacillaceae bacterium]